ncbi:MAG: sulfate adenylyltransferase subunit CysN [Gammaproteobacteria bacterium CG22_combo_CG10-13_8_21_14_all_40_8]|nr:MAG: sulfate adenylyltransferase subunit CysN [Gammaproteobacteria bacterium CG22_combo_CG10-13_8_21_14_all_40_8]
MIDQSALLENDILAYLKLHENKDMLRFLTCGSVDDGKSTLIGRLLHDSKMIFEDQFAAIERDSKKSGTQGDEVDLALLVDGLQSEREQGITIDVAYRYFATDKRKFIIADTPGHEQYTRNMATGASTCDLAIILIDAREGVKTQTRRHSFIISLLGIRHVIVAINKMDLVDYRQDVYDQIKSEYLAFSQQLNVPDIHFLPLSALKGDNVVHASEKLQWFHGQSLLQLLETIDITTHITESDFRFPVQYVNRPNSEFRGFSGNVAGGQVQVGDEIVVLPSKKTSSIKSIVTFDGEQPCAVTGQAVTLTLNDEIDISRGDMICLKDKPAQMSNGFEAFIVWMSEGALMPNKQYDIKFSTQYTSGSIDEVLHRVDVNSLSKMPATHLELNEIGLCRIKMIQSVAFDTYQVNRETGAFIIIDRLSNATVGAGMICQSLQHEDDNDSKISLFEVELNALIRKHFPHWQARDISRLFE